jgi:hypothetical protein
LPGLPGTCLVSAAFSDSLASAGWGETTIAAGELAEAVIRLRQDRPDGYLLAHGGARFARSLRHTASVTVIAGSHSERSFWAPITDSSWSLS